MPSELWRLEGVLDLLERIDTTMRDRSFAFVLGAGASVSSGIPSGKALAQDWLGIIHKRECMDNLDIEAWLQRDPLRVGDELSFANAAGFYPQIFERCFRGDHDAGYAALECAMDGRAPSIGYSLLAEILASTRHRVVITTNFDNLVADALAMHAHQSPLVVGHEALAGFVRPYSRRPLIAKIHRDLLFSPINDQAGVGELNEAWKNALRKLFQHYTPIVLGYGGNDGSLMGLLGSLEKGEIAGQIIWCYRNEPPMQALEVLDKHDGIRVQISDFDEFMLRLAGKLMKNFNPFMIAERIKKMGDERSEEYRKRTTDLHAALAQGDSEQKQTGALLVKSVRNEESWWGWQIRADAEPDFKKRTSIFEAAIQKFPQSAELHCNYANFLAENLKDFDSADAMYSRALSLNRESSRIAANYAAFLKKYRQDYDAAEKMYKSALENEKSDAQILANYAKFLADQRENFDAAEEKYGQAIKLAPGNPIVVVNYASFLNDRRRDPNAAETVYKRGLELAPTNVAIITNYAAFLQGIGNWDMADSMYKRATDLDPRNPLLFAHHAAFLYKCRKDMQAAEELFKRALQLDPNNADVTGDYASYLANGQASLDAAEETYKRSLELAPNDARLISNYAIFLENCREDFDGADKMYRRSLLVKPLGAGAAKSYAIFLAQRLGKLAAAQEMYELALTIEPASAELTGAYATFLLTKGTADGAEKMFRRAVALGSCDPNTYANFAFSLLTLNRNERDLTEAKSFCETALAQPTPDKQVQAECFLYLSLLDELGRRDPTEPLSRLKSILNNGYERGTWNFTMLFESLEPRLSAERREFYRVMGEAILDERSVSLLDRYPEWERLP